MMISYKPLLSMMDAMKVTSYTIRQDEVIGQSTISAIRNGKPITTKSIDALCRYFNCKVSDVIEYVADDQKETDDMQKAFDFVKSLLHVDKGGDK